MIYVSGGNAYDSHESYELIATRSADTFVASKKDVAILQNDYLILPAKS